MALGLSHDGHPPCSQERVDVKIVVLGRAGVGKSSLVEAFVDQRWGTGATASSLTSPTRVSAPTLDVNMAFKDVSLAGHHIRIELWDISGSKVHSDLLSSYYQRARGALIVFDGKKESFAEVQEWKESIDKLTASQDHPLPVMLIANKDDQWPHLPIVRDENSIADYCIRNKYSGWFATSAHTGLGVASAFLALTARICWPTMSDSELEEILSSTELSSPRISSKRPRGQLFSFPASRGASPLPCHQLSDLSPSSSHRLCSSKSSLSTVPQGSLRLNSTVTLRESRHACTSCPSQHSSRPSSVASTCSSDSACTHCDTPPTRRSLRLSPGARGGDTTKSKNDTATAVSVFKALLGAGLVGAALAPTHVRIAHTTATATATATATSTATSTTITSTTLAPLSISATNETQGPIVQSSILDSSPGTSADSIHGSQSPATWATAASPPRHIRTAITHTNTRGRVEKIADSASPQPGSHHSPLVPKEHSMRPR